MGPDTAGRHEFFDFLALACGTCRIRIVLRQEERLELLTAFVADKFVYRHNKPLI